MIYGVNLSIINNGQSAAKPSIKERSTTIPYGSTSQASGDGNALPRIFG